MSPTGLKMTIVSAEYSVIDLLIYKTILIKNEDEENENKKKLYYRNYVNPVRCHDLLMLS